MKVWSLAPPIVALLIVRLACAPSTPPHQGEHPCGFDPSNPAIVLYCSNSPTPSPSPPTTPTPTVNPSPTALSSNQGAWLHKIGTYTHQLRRAGDSAAQAFPNYATNPTDTSGYATALGESDGQPASGIGSLSPPPAGLETQYATLNTALKTLLSALRTYPLDAAAIVAAQNDYVSGCTAMQRSADAQSIGVDLRCSGPITPLSAADFVAAIAPAIATLHTKADPIQATYDALTPAQQADFTALSIYASGIANAYGLAAQQAIDPAPPASLAAAQTAFVDAANAVFTAGQDVEIQAKSSSDPAGLPSIAAAALTTLTPLRAAVEAACAQLQSAATAAGVTTSLGCRP